MSHFDVLRAAIAAEDGALVKTIGDAVDGGVPAAGRRPCAPRCGPRPPWRARRRRSRCASRPACTPARAWPSPSTTGWTISARPSISPRAWSTWPAGHRAWSSSAAVIDDPEVAAWLAEGGAQRRGLRSHAEGLRGRALLSSGAVRPAPVRPATQLPVAATRLAADRAASRLTSRDTMSLQHRCHCRRRHLWRHRRPGAARGAATPCTCSTRPAAAPAGRLHRHQQGHSPGVRPG